MRSMKNIIGFSEFSIIFIPASFLCQLKILKILDGFQNVIIEKSKKALLL